MEILWLQETRQQWQPPQKPLPNHHRTAFSDPQSFDAHPRGSSDCQRCDLAEFPALPYQLFFYQSSYEPSATAERFGTAPELPLRPCHQSSAPKPAGFASAATQYQYAIYPAGRATCRGPAGVWDTTAFGPSLCAPEYAAAAVLAQSSSRGRGFQS